MFYTPGLQSGYDPTAQSRAGRAEQAANEARTDIKEMQRQLDRLCLLNQALWELLRERLALSDAELARMAQEIDLRDGVKDGRITQLAVRCPTCQRVNNTRHKKCIYCSTEFDSMLFE